MSNRRPAVSGGCADAQSVWDHAATGRDRSTPTVRSPRDSATVAKRSPTRPDGRTGSRRTSRVVETSFPDSPGPDGVLQGPHGVPDDGDGRQLGSLQQAEPVVRAEQSRGVGVRDLLAMDREHANVVRWRSSGSATACRRRPRPPARRWASGPRQPRRPRRGSSRRGDTSSRRMPPSTRRPAGWVVGCSAPPLRRRAAWGSDVVLRVDVGLGIGLGDRCVNLDEQVFHLLLAVAIGQLVDLLADVSDLVRELLVTRGPLLTRVVSRPCSTAPGRAGLSVRPSTRRRRSGRQCPGSCLSAACLAPVCRSRKLPAGPPSDPCPSRPDRPGHGGGTRSPGTGRSDPSARLRWPPRGYGPRRKVGASRWNAAKPTSRNARTASVVPMWGGMSWVLMSTTPPPAWVGPESSAPTPGGMYEPWITTRSKPRRSLTISSITFVRRLSRR